MSNVKVNERTKPNESLYGLLDASSKAMVDAFVLFLYNQQIEKIRRMEFNEIHRIDFTTENIDKWIEENGQIEMLAGESGIEVMRELTKNDVW